MTARGRCVFFSATPFAFSQVSIARRICSLSGTPSRALMAFKRSACAGSIQNE